MRPSVALSVFFALAIAAGIFFRAYHLDRKTYWEDEIVGTVRALGYTEAEIVAASPTLTDAGAMQSYFRPRLVRDGVPRYVDTVRSLALEDPQHPPLYYVLSHVWIDGFGASVTAIRALPALLGGLALGAAFWFGLELFASRGVALLATASIAISPFHVLYAQEAREYSLWTLAILLCGVAFVRAVRSAAWWAWAVYAVTAAVALYVFPFTGLVVAGQGVALLALSKSERRAAGARYLVAAGCAALSFAPWLWLMVTNRAMERGLGRILTVRLSLRTIAGTLAKDLRQTFFDPEGAAASSRAIGTLDALATLAVLAVAVYALVVLFRRADRFASFTLAFAYVAPAIVLAASDALGHGMLVAQSRYFIPTYLGVEYAISYLLWTATQDPSIGGWRRTAWAAAAIALIASGAASCGASARADTWWSKDYEQSRDVAAVIDGTPNPLVEGTVHSSRAFGLAFYLEPRVKLALRLTCDNCDTRHVVYAARSAQRPAELSFSDVFILGAPPSGRGRTVATLRRDEPRYRAVGTSVFPVVAEPLGMFRAL